MELATASGRSSRYEKSLGVLATRFVRLLQEARDGVLDLKVAADSLAVRQKRRIYDITNVLEGVGLIEKKNKNVIQWRGKNMAGQTREAVEQLETLKAQMSVLEVQERELDQQKAWLEQSIEHLCNDPSTSAFVTHDDICSAFRGDTLLAVMAPSGTQLEVPLPEMGAACQKKYQVTLRSQTAPIHVVLINKESASSRPVVFSVPPADDVSAMPTPPSTPASLQRLPLSSSTAFSISTSDLASSYSSSQDSLCADHQQMALSQHDNVLALSSPPDLQMECHHIQPLSAPQAALAGQELHSMLDMSSLLKLSSTADHMKEEREGVADLIDELMSTDGVDYSFNLDDSEGVSDLFDVQILNY